VPNYDGSRVEPKVLPSKLPNLLLNGAMGIAVGMATNIPPHNLGELIDATVHLIDNPDSTIDDLMQYIKGPDFPTGAEIYGTEQIKAAYTTGKGSIVMRAVASIEEQKRGGFRIIISEIPYQVNKSELILKIADLVKNKKLEGISGLRDESDRTEGIRIVIDLKSSAYPKKILNRLYELTTMQTAFHVNTLALVDGIQPRILTLKNVLDEYLKHRQVVVRRRTEFELKRAKERAHILEGLRIALKNIDGVIATIRKSENRESAQKALCTKFKLTDIQANAILEMKLSALAALERQRVEDEYQEKLKLIKSLEEILGSVKKILEIIKKELTELKNKYATERKTKIFEQEIGKFKAEDLIPLEQVIVMLTKGNYIKRMPVSAYRSQVRGGKGVMGMETKEEDVIEHLTAASTHDDIMFFTDRGRVFQTKVYEIPSATRISKGQAIVNILQISPDEKVTAVITTDAKREDLKYFVMATAKGIVKKTDIELYKKVRKTGMVAIKLTTGDKLKWVKTTSGNDKIFMASAKGQAILYNEKDIRPMGRSAAGVRGILLKGDDSAVGIDVVLPSLEEKAFILIVLENGFGKRTPLNHFKVQLRGGMGMRVANVTQRTGKLNSMHLVYGDIADVIIASKGGQMIRMDLKSIKILSRDTQGVTLVKLHSKDEVASVTVVTKSAEEIVQKVEGEEQSVSVPQKEDRPVQEIPHLKETDSKAEIEKEVKDIEKDNENKEDQIIGESDKQAKITEKKSDDKKTVPEWAKAHKDSWREPSVTKLDKKIKVNNYKEKAKDPEELKKNLKKEDEPNYWGGKM
jgi:DNA gyrase subunit A